MPAAKIAITLDRELLREVDREVKGGAFRNRSKAIEEAVREKLERQRKRRVLAEARKLNPKEEKALAEEGIAEESEWPAY
jgi:Arc/MetJ-type ribon-helix-helix transcriptional regulator